VCPESDLENDFCTLVDTSPLVRSWRHQPRSISAVVDGEEVTSILDVEVHHLDGSTFYWEVKPAETVRAAAPGTRTWRQLEAQRRWSRLEHQNYGIATERHARRNLVDLANRKLIRASVAARQLQGLGDLPVRLQRAVGGDQRTVGDIHAEFSKAPQEDIQDALMWALYTGMVSADLTARLLSLGTLVRPYETPTDITQDSPVY